MGSLSLSKPVQKGVLRIIKKLEYERFLFSMAINLIFKNNAIDTIITEKNTNKYLKLVFIKVYNVSKELLSLRCLELF